MEKKTLFDDKYIGYHTFGLELNNTVGVGYEKEEEENPVNPNPVPNPNNNNETSENIS